MAIPVARLRALLVGSAVLLLVAVAGFLGYARYRAHRFLAGLPAKLGVDIRRETNGYTYSQSVGGKTVMTLHAAKAVEHTGGKITLHDVRMVLYGRKQDRADRISGAEFEYDQASGVVRAVGEVRIDLEAPARASAPAVPAAAGQDARLIHIKTSGLVYLQKLGVAATDQELEFGFGALTGRARGAEYNADTGMVILQSSVEAHGDERGVPATLTASHAELDRLGQVAVLTGAAYRAGGRSAKGDRAMVHLRADGTPERMEAEGRVTLEDATGDVVTAARGDAVLTDAGRASLAHLAGGVAFVGAGARQGTKGGAAEARVSFNGVGKPETMLLTGAARVEERATSGVRTATAGRLTLRLGADGQPREVEAAESARVVQVAEGGVGRSELSGDVLHGVFVADGPKKAVLRMLHGTGHTVLHRVLVTGAEQTSSGDVLDVVLRDGGGKGGDAVARATQTGHAVLVSRAAARVGGAMVGPGRATAEMAVYDGATEELTLTGSPRVEDASGTVAAGRVVIEQGSGDAVATGGVQVTYPQAGSRAGPVHVASERGEYRHGGGDKDGRAIFHAGVRPARMWQGASQVEASVIELEQAAGRLTAREEDPGTARAPSRGSAVHAVLVTQPGAGAKAEIVRVASGSMVYLDGSREVRFADAVTVENVDGVLHAREATAFLAAATASEPKAGGSTSNGASGLLGGEGLERIVAKGAVELDEPGRRAFGEQLVYTPGAAAGDGLFELTGTRAVPPIVIDEGEGTVTGERLTFHSGDKSVAVNGQPASAVGAVAQRARTVTRVKQR